MTEVILVLEGTMLVFRTNLPLVPNEAALEGAKQLSVLLQSPQQTP